MPQILKRIDVYIPTKVNAFVLLFLICVSFLLMHLGNRAVEKNARDFFDLYNYEIVEKLNNTFFNYRQLFRGGVGLFLGSGNVQRKEWKAYVDRLKLDEHFPGIRAFAYGEYIRASEKEAYIEAVKESGMPDFTIFPDTSSDELVVTRYLEPFESENKKIHGFDMWSEPVRRAAMMTARDDGQTAVSAVLQNRMYWQEDSSDPGFFMFLPVFHTDMTANTKEERRKNLKGFVYGVISVDDLIESNVLKQLESMQIGVEIYDGNEILPEKMIYRSFDLATYVSGNFYLPEMSAVQGFKFKNHQWTIHFVSLPNFGVGKISKNEPKLILVISLLVSFLLFLFLQSVSKARDHAESYAERKVEQLKATQEELEMMALVAQKTSDSVIVTDSYGLTEWVNPAFEKLTGYSLAEMKDRKPGDLLQGEETDPSVVQEMSDAIRLRKSFKTELVNYSKSGEKYWLDIQINPFFE